MGVGRTDVRDELRVEVDRNYDFFQRSLACYLEGHADEYALLKSQAVVDFFDGPGLAYRAGLARFPDKIFSVQKVTDEPVELGFMSLAFA
jgi:hypothetical protein